KPGHAVLEDVPTRAEQIRSGRNRATDADQVILIAARAVKQKQCRCRERLARFEAMRKTQFHVVIGTPALAICKAASSLRQCRDESPDQMRRQPTRERLVESGGNLIETLSVWQTIAF